uniref:sugar MFS transporter n=1 Tax=Prevotella sp. TaxID=59823 RepID=UPI0040269AC6
MMKTIDRRHAVPFALVTSMFLLWGLANNMTDTLLAAFKRIMSMSDTQTSLIQFAFYGSYFCFALPAALFIRRRSFKSGIILGLLLYAAGAMLFLPAARVASYGFYLVAIYVMAGGCSVLETTANPYVMSMGDPRTATRRLNIAQSFNPVGSILGILMSKYFILDDISLYSISGTYAALGLVLLGILVVMLFARMPSGKDDDRSDSVGASFRRLLSNRLYRRGVVAQFFYVGAQIGVWSFTIRLVMQETGRLEAAASSIYLISIVGHCLSRFIYTGLMRWFSPSRLLTFGGVMSALLSLTVVLSAGTGWLCITSLVLISSFMSLMFPTIYGIALGGIMRGDHPGDSKIGASGLIMSILGGALLTPLQGMVSDHTNIYTSYAVPAFCFVVVTAYAVYAHRCKATL